MQSVDYNMANILQVSNILRETGKTYVNIAIDTVRSLSCHYASTLIYKYIL